MLNQRIKVLPLRAKNQTIHNKTGVIKGFYGSKTHPSYFAVNINGDIYTLTRQELELR